MVFPKASLQVEKACAFTRLAVIVESVREFRKTFERKFIFKEVEKGEFRKMKSKKRKIQPTPYFCPDAETDIPETLQDYRTEIQAYFSE